MDIFKRPVAFYPVLAELFGGINEALLWQQIHYWSDKGKLEDGWVYKTSKELQEETTLKRWKQDKARKNLVEKGYLKTELRKVNGAPTLHYKINLEKVYRDLGLELYETNKSICRKHTNPLYTENTYIHKGEETSPSENLPIKESKEKKPTNKELAELYRLWGENYPKNWFVNKTQRLCASNLLEERGLEKVKRALEFWVDNKEDMYCPDVSTPYDLDSKWTKLLHFRKRQHES